jgi:hypothetical protein
VGSKKLCHLHGCGREATNFSRAFPLCDEHFDARDRGEWLWCEGGAGCDHPVPYRNSTRNRCSKHGGQDWAGLKPAQPQTIPAGTRVKVVGIKGDSASFQSFVGKIGTVIDDALTWKDDGYIGRLDFGERKPSFSGICRWVVEVLPTEAPAKDEPCTLPEIPAGAKIRLHLKSGEAWDGTTSEPLRREADGSYSGRRVNYGMRGHMDMDHCTISLLSLPEAPKAAHACEHGGCGKERMRGGRTCAEHRFRERSTCLVDGCEDKTDESKILCPAHRHEYALSPYALRDWLASRPTGTPTPKPEAPKSTPGVNGAAKPNGVSIPLHIGSFKMSFDGGKTWHDSTLEPYASVAVPPPPGAQDVTPEPETKEPAVMLNRKCDRRGCTHQAEEYYPGSKVSLCDPCDREWEAVEDETLMLRDWIKQAKERPMSKINPKKELSAAGLRLAGDLFVDNVSAMLKAAIIAGVGDGSPEMERRIEAFFASEVGKSIVDVAAAGGATLIPGVPESFSEELRIRAAHKGAYKLTNAVVGPLRDMAGDALKAAMPGKKRAKKPAAGALPAEPAQKRETIEISEAEIAEPATVGAKSGRVR